MKIILNKIEEYKAKREEKKKKLLEEKRYDQFPHLADLENSLLTEKDYIKRKEIFEQFEKEFFRVYENKIEHKNLVSEKMKIFYCDFYVAIIYHNNGKEIINFDKDEEMSVDCILEKTKNIKDKKKIYLMGPDVSETILEINF